MLVFNLYFSLKEQYCRNASFLMNRFSLHMVRTLKDKVSGRYLWNPSLAAGTPDSLLGLPVYPKFPTYMGSMTAA